jgi:hypothetical protein
MFLQGAGYTYYTYDMKDFIDKIEKHKKNKLYWNEDRDYFSNIDIDKISQFLTWRNTVSKEKCMYRVSGDNISFFSDDISLLRTLECIDPAIKYSKVDLYGNTDVMYFSKNPKFKFRTYFRAKRMPKDFSDNVRNLKDIYANLNFSQALLKTLFHHMQYNSYRYLHGSYYVEYDDEQMVTILNIWFPNMLGKTYTLQKAP